MTSDEERAWMAMALYCQAAEQATTVGDAPLDLQAWLEKHNQMWPPEFAWEDWSRYQPAIRKIHLVRKEEKTNVFLVYFSLALHSPELYPGRRNPDAATDE